MRVIQKTSNHDIANVYIGQTHEGKLVEFVESTQPPMTRKEKWVLIISTLFGCPSNCKFCDAGGSYDGKLSYEDLMFQIDYLIRSRFPDRKIDTQKFKIQFARMGEPAFNNAVLDVLRDLPQAYDLPGFVPSLSTIGPVGTDPFFAHLADIKHRLYDASFQLQFSIHSTDYSQRDKLMPIRKWSFEKIASYARDFFDPAGKKIALNFALAKGSIFDIDIIKKYFHPDLFIIKLTPINPTLKAFKNNLESLISSEDAYHPLANRLQEAGYDVILSIGEWEENKIGSNCGQYVNAVKNHHNKLENSYSYNLETL